MKREWTSLFYSRIRALKLKDGERLDKPTGGMPATLSFSVADKQGVTGNICGGPRGPCNKHPIYGSPLKKKEAKVDWTRTAQNPASSGKQHVQSQATENTTMRNDTTPRWAHDDWL